MNLQNETAAVIGLARAGLPAAKFLAQNGAHVLGYDSKNRDEFSARDELEALGIELFLGEHGFAGIERAQLIVLSPGLKIHFEPLKSLLESAQARGAQVIGELELASRFCPCPIIGITGTKGKSTTTKLVTEMLRACGVDAHSAGNTGTPLIEMLPELKPQSWAVVEVSSFQLEKAPTFRPKIAVLLSLLEDHQDFHPTLEQYWETKLGIFANQGEGDVAIFNVDDPRVEKFAQGQFKGRKVLTSGQPHEDPWGVLAVAQTLDFLSFFDAKHACFVIPTDAVPLSGQHNLSNVAAAIGVALEVVGDEKSEKISDAIFNFQSLPHRLEIVARKNGVTYVNDSQSTIPDASIAALRSFPAPVVLLLGGRAKIEAQAYEKLMGEIRDSGARVVLFGEAAAMLRSVALSTGVEKRQIFREKTLAEAVNTAKMNCGDGAAVILSPACASFDQFQSYEHRGQTFRDLVDAL